MSAGAAEKALRVAHRDKRTPLGFVGPGGVGTLVIELLKLAGNDSCLAGLSADEVESRDGGLGKVDDAAGFESYASILGSANRDEVSGEGQAGMPFELMHWSMQTTNLS